MAELTGAQPRGLFSRIIRRLGLERQAQVIRKHLSIIVPGLCAATIFGIWVVHVLDLVLRWSSFGPVFRVALSDPDFVALHGGSFTRSVLGSVPPIELAFTFFSLAAILLLVRWMVQGIVAYRAVQQDISHQYYEHH